MKESTPTTPPPPPTPAKAKTGAGLLMVPPKPADARPQHRRASSTGTTGDESATTDDDEPPAALYAAESGSFGSFTDIATIADTLMHRNSSDSSVYSDLGLGEGGARDQGDWARGAPAAAVGRLQDELRDAHQELKAKDEEVARLSRIRQDVEAELEDLTASLFQEAHNMVREANEKQALAEKAHAESQMKVDVLTAEVAALKTLVLTSTPSRPNAHLHPQITGRHRRSPSHLNLRYGRASPPPGSPAREPPAPLPPPAADEAEVDPGAHRDFLAWRRAPTLDPADAFVRRVYAEDVELCLRFDNAELGAKVRAAVEAGAILVEAVGDRTKAMFPKKCALLEVPRLCFYRMNIGETDNWYSISQICRNRIIAVCEFLNYLKYVERGLVKSSPHDIYWEIVRLRKDMVLARLGLNLTP